MDERPKLTLGMSHDISLADVLTIVGMVSGAIWVGAVMKADVDSNGRDIRQTQSWIAKHQDDDEKRGTALDERLRQIEGKLDVLIGEFESEKRRR